MHGALWKVEGWRLRPLGCTHALEEGTFLSVKVVCSKEYLVSQTMQFRTRKGNDAIGVCNALLEGTWHTYEQ